jgi:DNA-binding LacI/PurR family transcriptional regulator
MSKPTMEDVARRAGVSRALVSLVMRNSDKVSPRSRAAVLEAAEALGYRPNLNARHLASKRTRTLGLLINDLHNPFFPAVADGIKAASDEHGYRLLMNSAFFREDVEQAALETFVDFNVDGIVLSGAHIAAEIIEQIARSVPVAVASRPIASDLVDTVNNDDALGARIAVEHLVELGHRRICHLDGGRGAGAVQRRAGFVATMEEHGLEPLVVGAAFTESAGARAAAVALEQSSNITAFFAGNDLSALGALDAIEASGRSVPDDVSLVGYDNTSVAALGHVDLTTIDQGAQRLGQLAVEMLIERIEEGRTEARHIVIPPWLVVRRTTAPPRS